MKKVLSLVLALSMVLCMFPFAFASELSDVEDTKYAGSVDALVELGILNGYPDGTFKPEKNVTRAEMAKILVISLGLESAAELAKGETQFTDVAADHWATGYINVAAANGIIIGYPEGDFRPEAEVTYAEAITMALRALGYKSVIERSGTWPTNYMQKAVELELLDDMGTVGGNTAAIRGNISLLVWNMLTTEMWVIKEENSSTGATYGKSDKVMLNIKFPNYKYIEEAYVSDVAVSGTEVTLTLVDDDDFGAAGTKTLATGEIETADFLTLYGRKVSALLNTKTEVFVAVSALDTVVEGKLAEKLPATLTSASIEVNEKTYKTASTLRGTREYNATDGETHAMLVMDGGKVVSITTYAATNFVVETLKVVKDDLKVNGSKLTLTDEDLILFEGLKVDFDEIEVEDVITKLENGSNDIYIITRNTVEGDVTKYIEGTAGEYDGDDIIEVDGDEYYIWDNADAIIYVDEEKMNLDDLTASDWKALKDEEIVLTLDYFGEVVRMDVGKLSPTAASNEGIYLISSEGTWSVKDSSGSTKYVKLMGLDEEESYVVKSNAKFLNKDGATVAESTFEKGKLVYVEFNSKDEVTLIQHVLTGWNNGESTTSKNYLAALDISDAEYKDGYIEDDYKVSADVVVYSVYTSEDEDGDEELTLESDEGREAVADLDGEDILIVFGQYNTVKYVLLNAELGSKDLKFGVVESVKYNRIGDAYTIKIEDEDGDITEYEVKDDADAAVEEGSLVIFKVNSQDEFILVIEELEETNIAGIATSKNYPYVKSVTDGGSIASLLLDEDTKLFDLGREKVVAGIGFTDTKLADVKFVVTEVSTEVDSFRVYSAEDMRFRKGDRLLVDATNKVIVVIRGLAEVELSSIAVTTQPSDLAYTAGQTFDPTDMVVKATYTNGMKQIISHANLSLTPSVTVELTVADHHNEPVAISYTENGVTKTANTSNLTVTAP